jgi:hypothetical protein
MADQESFDELLATATASAVHLEIRDWYGVEEEREDFAEWRAAGQPGRTDQADRERERRRDWIDLIRATTARGVVVRRARIVSEPVTEYIKFEWAGTPLNIEAGEQVRWLPRRRASDLCLPGNDFWVMDDKIVQLHHFSGDGAWVDHERSEDSALIKHCRSAFEAVWARAIDHADYQIT